MEYRVIITVTLNPAIDKTVEISAMALGQVNRIKSTFTEIGGKGINVSKVVRELGGVSKVYGIIGGSNGELIEKYLDGKKIEYDFIHGGLETRVNLKIVDTVNKEITEINEAGGPYSNEVFQHVIVKLRNTISNGDIVVLAGSLPQGADKTYYNQLIQVCKEKYAKVFLDVDGGLLKAALPLKPYLIKPNEHELNEMYGRKLEFIEDKIEVAKELVKSGVENVILSLGKEGAIFGSRDKIIFGHGLSVEVRNTVGAGDSMIAAYAYGVEQGLAIEDCVKLSIATSAAKVMLDGTKAPDLNRINELKNQVKYEVLAT